MNLVDQLVAGHVHEQFEKLLSFNSIFPGPHGQDITGPNPAHQLS